VVLAALVAANLATCLLLFHLPAAWSALSACTALLTPSIYPASQTLRQLVMPL
jgi:hypothetical protein